MHELAITESLIGIIDSEARDKGFKRVLAISLRVGEYSGLVPECIREFFPIAAKDGPARGAELVIETVPAAFKCLDCGFEGQVDRRSARCPDCGGQALKMTAGREFYVESLTVE